MKKIRMMAVAAMMAMFGMMVSSCSHKVTAAMNAPEGSASDDTIARIM